MYLKHFGLSEFPFGLTPDTQFYFGLPSHKEALNVLLIALQSGEGFIKITGDVGTGKTMLCRKLLNQLQAPFITAYIPNPHLTPAGLRLAVADELGIPHGRDNDQSRILQRINKHLLKSASKKQKTIIVIDEAQAMSEESLEALRLLTNLETEKQKLLQIILLGQPELDTLLQKKSIRQLRQRITFSYTLKTLTTKEITDYIKHRLRIANINNPNIFSKPALLALHFYSKGVPRIVNILAHKAMLSAYGKDLTRIGLKQVQLAAQDTDETCNRHHPFEFRIGFLFALLASLGLLITQQIGILS
ncbi:MAG: AAA family ATPase [Methylococcales bacterium]|nr:AAA family ATPase [Methylococcales bacterium]